MLVGTSTPAPPSPAETMSMAFRPPQFQLKYLLPSEARRILMYSFFAKLVPQIFHTSFKFRSLCTAATFSANTCEVSQPPCRKKSAAKDSVRIKVKISDSQLKENWLTSMSCPFPDKSIGAGGMKSNAGSAWVIGIDPDLSGALAVIRNDDSGCSAQVFDSPYLQVPVGKRARRRLDAKSIVKLLRGLEAPLGTTAYIEQSIPYPQDGKQGWWSGGFGFGLWIGILVASGFSVIPVPSLLWKNEFELAGNHSGKDDSRKLASALFPSLSSVLQRKKDHGRAEALLIAAYGRKLKMKSDSSCILEKLVP